MGDLLESLGVLLASVGCLGFLWGSQKADMVFWVARGKGPAKFTHLLGPEVASFWRSKKGDFSCYLLASFFDRLLKASGGILGAILADFGS